MGMLQVTHEGAVLCPIRDNGDLFFVRRAVWNPLAKRPMSYPGEWAFAGGKPETGDATFLDTATREFREETGYCGDIVPIRSYMIGGVMYYLAALDKEPTEHINNDELIDSRWLSAQSALELILSKEFSLEQEKRLMPYGFSRKMPYRTIDLLEKLK